MPTVELWVVVVGATVLLLLLLLPVNIGTAALPMATAVMLASIASRAPRVTGEKRDDRERARANTSLSFVTLVFCFPVVSFCCFTSTSPNGPRSHNCLPLSILFSAVPFRGVQYLQWVTSEAVCGRPSLRLCQLSLDKRRAGHEAHVDYRRVRRRIKVQL